LAFGFLGSGPKLFTWGLTNLAAIVHTFLSAALPRFGFGLPRLTFDTILDTALNAFLALVIVPFLPYEGLAFTIAIPFFIAWLNLVIRFLRLSGAKAIVSCTYLSSRSLSWRPLSSAAANKACPGSVWRAAYPNPAPIAPGAPGIANAAAATGGALVAAPITKRDATLRVVPGAKISIPIIAAIAFSNVEKAMPLDGLSP
jgi:hypothetical protein